MMNLSTYQSRRPLIGQWLASLPVYIKYCRQAKRKAAIKAPCEPPYLVNAQVLRLWPGTSKCEHHSPRTRDCHIEAPGGKKSLASCCVQ